MRKLLLRDTENGRKPARNGDPDVDLQAVVQTMARFGVECRLVEVIKDDVNGMRQCVMCMEMHPVDDFTRTTTRLRKSSTQPRKKPSERLRVYTVRVCPDCMLESNWNRGRGVHQ